MILSIVIANYNGKGLLRDCLNSIYAHPPSREYEVVVVDDCSRDGSQQMVQRNFPQVLLLSNAKNSGFSYASNRGIEISRGKYVLLLNNDTLVMEGSLDSIIQFMDENPQVDVCGCKLLTADGTLHRSTQTFPRLWREFFHANPVFKKLYRGDGSLSHRTLLFFLHTLKTQWASFIDYSRTTEVDVVTGAVFMFRRHLVDEIGLFDENYFMYVEEVDYCYRLKEKGRRVCYYPRASIIHLLGQTTKQDFKKKRWTANPFLTERYKSMLYFFDKHYSKVQLHLLRLIVIEGHSLRLSLNALRWLLRPQERQEARRVMSIYSEIIKLAVHYKSH
jgi:GT2 family glycosyltransferase